MSKKPDPMTMETLQQQAASLFERVVSWFNVEIWSDTSLIQLCVLAACFLLADIFSRYVKRGLDKACEKVMAYHRMAPYVTPLYRPTLFVLILLIGEFTLASFSLPSLALEIARNLLTAWIVIRIAVYFIRNESVARGVAIFAWSLAALNIVGWLDPITGVLDGTSFAIGDGAELSILEVITGSLTFVLLIWLGLLLARFIEARLNDMKALDPSARVLIGKTVKIAILAIAFLAALNSTGIDLTALAVFGGALGVGIGFGLQKVISNFVSGLILLVDRSIKPGDVIEIQGAYGWIDNLAARFTSIVTRDGTEYLIPNEDMITQVVVNWSHSNTRVRRRLPLNVSYSSDLNEAIRLANEAAEENSRVLKAPAPRTLLRGFGDNGVDLELRIWINDPQNGVANVSSEVLLAIWDKFNAAGVEFPFPQRVVHLADDNAESVKDLLPATDIETVPPSEKDPA